MMLRSLGIRDEMGNSGTGKEFLLFLSSFLIFHASFLFFYFLHLINEIGRHEIHAINPGGDGVTGQARVDDFLFTSCSSYAPLFPQHQFYVPLVSFFFLFIFFFFFIDQKSWLYVPDNIWFLLNGTHTSTLLMNSELAWPLINFITLFPFRFLCFLSLFLVVWEEASLTFYFLFFHTMDYCPGLGADLVNFEPIPLISVIPFIHDA